LKLLLELLVELELKLLEELLELLELELLELDTLPSSAPISHAILVSPSISVVIG